ncbi:MAG TPA: choice-of-anchor D domain-containing protein [Myxococcota bacterium]|nr:choice-of-anchor D domain-containing protein [Myxococcota bacterium]HRY94999.1 choice-of-anchor D domain-containing protein [Myxococcota bacterium]HSA22026.1 choice-of-anchor D domain-containing protein [Myxococcota bacterium]
MNPRQIRLAIVALALLPIALGCECGGSEFVPQSGNIGRYHVSTGTTPPPLDQYAEAQPGVDPDRAEVAVDFGSVDVDTQAMRYLFFRNTGTADLLVGAVSFEQGADPAFAVACLQDGSFVAGCPYSDSAPLAIPAGGDLVIQAAFAPQEVRAHAAAFVIVSTAADFSEVRVSLTGAGVTPEIQVCISDCVGDQGAAGCSGATDLCNDVAPGDLRVDFGDGVTGQTSTRRVVVKNLGNQSLVVSLIQLSGGDASQFAWTAAGDALPGTLAAGQEVELSVTYTPTTGGEHASELQILSNDVNEGELRVDLAGRGLAPRVCPEPLTVDFGTVPVGESREGSFLLTNCGLLELSVSSIALTADSSADFSMVSPTDFPLVLQPGESATVTAAYTPTDRGSDLGGAAIFSNDPASDPATGLTGVVALRGNGLVLECDILAVPSPLNFGGVVQQQSDVQLLVLSNVGNHQCTFLGAEITQNSAEGEFGVLSAPPSGTVFQPGDTLQLEVSYAPTALGLDAGVLTLTGTDKDGPTIDVPLVGEGVATAVCELSVTPASLRFGTTKLNNTRALYITLENSGNAPCQISGYEMTHGILFPYEFTVTGAPPTPFNVARRGQAGSRVDLEITFAPSQLGLHAAAFWVTSNDPDLQQSGSNPFDQFSCTWPAPPEPGQACVPISGSAAESNIEVVPSELDFGVVTLGCNSPELRVTVYNLGTIDLNVADIYLEDPADPNFEIRQAPATPYALPGGQSFEVRLRYHPQDMSVHRNSLYIVSDASNEDMLIVPLFGRGTNISDQTDVFHQPTEVKSDVLFVVDNSGSMGWAQTELANNFASFIAYATSLEVDYHIGVITTEVNDAETGQGDPDRDIFPGVLVQAPGRPKIITNQTPELNAAFTDNVNVGTCCSDEQEAGLQAAHMALSEPLVSDPAANDGFVREDAKLYLIMLSDEQDQSRGEPDFYVDFFQSIKGFRNTAWMKMSAIVGDAPDGCPAGAAEPTAGSGSRYIEVANRTGGIFESICTSNWAQSLQNLGIDAFAAIQEFPLSRPADPGSISVTVDGVAVPPCGTPGCSDGYTYYPDSNTIFFGDGIVPEKGDRIEIHYTAACL